MTDRVDRLIVVLEENVRIDDVEGLRRAIEQFSGVLSVSARSSDPGTAFVERHRASARLTEKMIEFAEEVSGE